MKYLIGIKQGMTQKFLNDGTAVPITVVQAGPCHVTAVKTVEKDGYAAVQIGFHARKKLSKPERGHLKNLPMYGTIKEFPQKKQPLIFGQELTVAQFAKGDEIKVTGNSKGKGFQGVVKRHGFHGSPKTHGHKDQLRMSGSIGAGGVQRVFKNMRMAGRMGNEKVTATHLEVVEVLPEENLIFIKGPLPGPNQSIVYLYSDSESDPTPITEKPKSDVPKQEAHAIDAERAKQAIDLENKEKPKKEEKK